MKEELRYQVALNLLHGIGSILAKQLVSYCGSVEQVFKSSKSRLSRIPGIGEKTAKLIKNANLLESADNEIEKCIQAGVDIHFYTDKTYPYKLKQTVDCPLILYSRGSKDINCPRAIAVVGTRQSTEYGRTATQELVDALKPYSCTIISGLAYGIDITAHRAALEAGLPTMAVLGSGLDVIYPSMHRATADEMLSDGALISEYPLGTQPEAYNFPPRNRIIAGMSDAVVVIEAAAKGGALITADMANSYNREVFALPGNLDHRHSVGCNKLIQQQKAIIFTSVEDLVEELNWDMENVNGTVPDAVDLMAFTQHEQLIISLLTEDKQGLEIDKLAWKSQLTVNQLASVLLSLEFSGVVKALPGKKYRLKSRF